jgi:hypothetical protein
MTFVYATDPEGNIIEIQNWSQVGEAEFAWPVVMTSLITTTKLRPVRCETTPPATIPLCVVIDPEHSHRTRVACRESLEFRDPSTPLR